MGEYQKAFKRFVRYCELVTDRDQEVISLLNKRYSRARPAFLSSKEFSSLLETTTTKIRSDVENRYVHIKDFVTELKAFGKKPEQKAPPVKRKLDADADPINPQLKRVKLLATSGNDSDTSSTVSCPQRPNGNDKHHSDAASSDTHANGAASASSAAINGAALSSTSAGEESETEIADKCAAPAKTVAGLQQDASDKPPEVMVGSPAGVSTGKSASVPSSSPPPSPSASTSTVKRRSSTRGKPPGNDVEAEVSPSPSPSPSPAKATSKAAVKDSGATSKGSKRQIRHLEKLLADISGEIEKLEEQELTLDDLKDEDGAYTLIDRYKKKFVKVWQKLCEIKGRSTMTGRTIERKFRFEGSRYPEINRKIEKFINKHRIFPDFQDVRLIISSCNRKHHLRITKKQIDSLSRETFTDVGNQLQERRHQDFVATFGCHVTDRFRSHEDPAMYDKDLKKKLEANRQVSKSNMDEMLSKYSAKQDNYGESTESEEEEEEEDEEEDEVEEKVVEAEDGVNDQEEDFEVLEEATDLSEAKGGGEIKAEPAATTPAPKAWNHSLIDLDEGETTTDGEGREEEAGGEGPEDEDEEEDDEQGEEDEEGQSDDSDILVLSDVTEGEEDGADVLEVASSEGKAPLDPRGCFSLGLPRIIDVRTEASDSDGSQRKAASASASAPRRVNCQPAEGQPGDKMSFIARLNLGLVQDSRKVVPKRNNSDSEDDKGASDTRNRNHRKEDLERVNNQCADRKPPAPQLSGHVVSGHVVSRGRPGAVRDDLDAGGKAEAGDADIVEVVPAATVTPSGERTLDMPAKTVATVRHSLDSKPSGIGTKRFGDHLPTSSGKDTSGTSEKPRVKVPCAKKPSLAPSVVPADVIELSDSSCDSLAEEATVAPASGAHPRPATAAARAITARKASLGFPVADAPFRSLLDGESQGFTVCGDNGDMSGGASQPHSEIFAVRDGEMTIKEAKADDAKVMETEDYVITVNKMDQSGSGESDLEVPPAVTKQAATAADSRPRALTPETKGKGSRTESPNAGHSSDEGDCLIVSCPAGTPSRPSPSGRRHVDSLAQKALTPAGHTASMSKTPPVNRLSPSPRRVTPSSVTPSSATPATPLSAQGVSPQTALPVQSGTPSVPWPGSQPRRRIQLQGGSPDLPYNSSATLLSGSPSPRKGTLPTLQAGSPSSRKATSPTSQAGYTVVRNTRPGSSSPQRSTPWTGSPIALKTSPSTQRASSPSPSKTTPSTLQAGSPFLQKTSPSTSTTGSPFLQKTSPSTSTTGSPFLQKTSPSTSTTGSPFLKKTSPSTSTTGSPSPHKITPSTSRSGSPSLKKTTPSTSKAGSPTPHKDTPSTSKTGSPTPHKTTPSTSRTGSPSPYKTTPSPSQAGSPSPHKTTPSTQQAGFAPVPTTSPPRTERPVPPLLSPRSDLLRKVDISKDHISCVLRLSAEAVINRKMLVEGDHSTTQESHEKSVCRSSDRNSECVTSARLTPASSGVEEGSGDADSDCVIVIDTQSSSFNSTTTLPIGRKSVKTTPEHSRVPSTAEGASHRHKTVSQDRSHRHKTGTPEERQKTSGLSADGVSHRHKTGTPEERQKIPGSSTDGASHRHKTGSPEERQKTSGLSADGASHRHKTGTPEERQKTSGLSADGASHRHKTGTPEERQKTSGLSADGASHRHKTGTPEERQKIPGSSTDGASHRHKTGSLEERQKTSGLSADGASHRHKTGTPEERQKTSGLSADGASHRHKTGTPEERQKTSGLSADGASHRHKTGTPEERQKASGLSADGVSHRHKTGTPEERQKTSGLSADGVSHRHKIGTPEERHKTSGLSADGASHGHKTGTPEERQKTSGLSADGASHRHTTGLPEERQKTSGLSVDGASHRHETGTPEERHKTSGSSADGASHRHKTGSPEERRKTSGLSADGAYHRHKTGTPEERHTISVSSTDTPPGPPAKRQKILNVALATKKRSDSIIVLSDSE